MYATPLLAQISPHVMCWQQRAGVAGTKTVTCLVDVCVLLVANNNRRSEGPKDSTRPLLEFVMIVKDEAKSIVKTIESVKPWVDRPVPSPDQPVPSPVNLLAC